MAQDAQLISQASKVESLASDGLVSVSTGAGQPQKNMELAKFADSLGSSVPLQQTSEQVNITGLYARTSDGKMVELTKESVASVMSELIGTASFSKNGLMPASQFLSKSEVFANTAITSLSQIKDGMSFYFGAGTDVMPSSNGCVLKFSGSNCSTYFASNEKASNLFQRTIREGYDSGWQRIDNFGYNSLAELSSGVAEQMNNVEYEVSSDDAVVIAQEVVSKVTSLMFNVIANGSTRSLVSGYVYPNKLYGLITVSKYDGSVTIVTLNNGSFTKS